MNLHPFQNENISTCIPFKTSITQYKDRLQLKHMARKDMEYILEGKMYQFHVGYMINLTLKTIVSIEIRLSNNLNKIFVQSQ